MADIPYLYVAVVALVAALVGIAVWSRRGLRWRSSALALGALLLAVNYVALVDLLSRPKPAALEFRHIDPQTLKVLYADWVENSGIFLLLELPDADEPRYYRLPWHASTAQQLQQVMRGVQAEPNSELRMNNPFLMPDEEEREQLFHAAPQPPPPLKRPREPQPADFGTAGPAEAEDLEKRDPTRVER